MNILKLKVQVDAGATRVVVGRVAWALLELLAAGNAGCTYFDNSAPRWSAYIHQLRKIGVVIATIREKHGGQFSGYHARYVLRSAITIIDTASGV